MSEIKGFEEKIQNKDNNCISTCTSTCEKDINNHKKLQEEKMGAEKIKDDYSNIDSYEELTKLTRETSELQSDEQINKELKTTLFASHHLNRAEEYVPKELLSKENFDKIQLVSKLFPGNLTTFLGFETRLGEQKNIADFAFAISGVGKDRKILLKMLEEEQHKQNLLKHSEWNQIKSFVDAWADPNSELNDKVQCFWLEFDMPNDELKETPIPSVFFGPSKNSDNYEWLTNTAIPLLKGKKVPVEITNLIHDCINKIPVNSKLFQIGTMLSRKSNAIRLHINKINPEQIIPYLKEIGYNYDTKELKNLINDLENLADRFVISFDITEEGIRDKIGIELSFTDDKFQNEGRWEHLMDYLVKKNACIPQKRNALLTYQGSETEDNFSGALMKPIYSATDYSDDLSKSNVVRYINHIKLVYRPGEKLIAKAYPAVRLFEKKTTMIEN